ncbi:MAG: hypothetical protein SGJ19_05570 [Planctomycetia bacterium]|nr:hypothetical protein [Planctomycetia bacterium]
MRPDQYSGHEQPDDGRQAQTVKQVQNAPREQEYEHQVSQQGFHEPSYLDDLRAASRH